MPRSPRAILAWAHLAVLWSFAVAQPLFGILADSPEFFVARGNRSEDILLFAFAIVLVPPTLMVGLAKFAERMHPAGAWVQPVLVGLLVVAIALQILTDLAGEPHGLLLAMALLVGAAGGVAYARLEPARTVLTVLVPMPLVFLVVFLASSPVSKLVFGGDDVAASDVTVGRPAPVVMVVFDEFSTEALMTREGAIDRERFPNFAALARDATWYRNATTVADHTTDAVPSLVTGSFPRTDALPIASDYPRSLFTLLGGAYSLANVHEPASDVCPESLCRNIAQAPLRQRVRALTKDLGIVYLHRVLPAGLASGLPPVDRAFGGFGDEGDAPTRANVDDVPEAAHVNRRTQFARFIRGIRPDAGRPALHFLHVLLPHTFWQYLPSGQQHPTAGPDIPGLDAAGVWAGHPFLVEQAGQRKLLQTGFVDRLVGRLVKRLQAVGIYGRALIVLTADHGISFRPGESRRAVAGPGFPDVAGVPLFVKLPGQVRGGVDDGRATGVDVLPTIAEALGARLDWELAGRSLLDAERGSGPLSVAAYPDLRRVEEPFADFVTERDKQVARLTSTYGQGDWGSAYAIGPDGDLLGDPAGEPAVTERPSGSVQLDGTPLYASYEAGGLLVPSFVTGRLSGVPSEARVAVAVNGRIAATAYSYETGGEVRIGAMVPPWLLRSGSNRVSLYRVVGDTPAARRLHLISDPAAGAAEAELTERDGGSLIELGDGSEVQVVDDAATGYVERVRAEAGSIEVIGWAIDEIHRKVADEVLVFGDERLIARGRPDLARPDVARHFEQPGLETSGFRLIGASEQATEVATPERLRVLAVVDGQASDLPVDERVFQVP